MRDWSEYWAGLIVGAGCVILGIMTAHKYATKYPNTPLIRIYSTFYTASNVSINKAPPS